MPSPFPGMDPFIESQRWEDFHHALSEVIREWLIPHVRPRYVVLVEERVYVERQTDGHRGLIIPDVTVLEREGQEMLSQGAAAATAVAVAPVILTLPMPERKREAFLTIRERETMEVVTVIEVLSPDNKRPGAEGRREYLRKRETVLESEAHLIELDLLRGGERLPTVEPLPAADYYAFVSRAPRRPKVAVYPWTLRQALPTIPVPLAEGDPEVGLDLQSVFNTVYDRAGYDYSLDYRRPLEPPLREADIAWVKQVLGAACS
ncbi:MAG: DUF4058 family protein [Abditibacteriales bacterium]|nr:DUF4058 family protein [Abditibacteriales bacterium]MDW8364903.1 DUF4058 family protein [Abditibacteriales bacterium]